MKKSRIIVLFLAVAAALGAFLLANGQRPPAPEIAAAPKAAPAPATDDVLVAAKDLPLGTLVDDAALSWQAWPKDAVAPGMIRKTDDPQILGAVKGSIARASLFQGEPIRREKLVKGLSSGFLSAVLPAGRRAVAITIDNSGSASAGNFIFPQDRVDVIRTARDESKGSGGGQDAYLSETILRNVRVLAIGPNVQEKNGQPVVSGSTATLELSPAQSEAIVLAQRTGQLSLTLRSMLDANQTHMPEVETITRGMTVVRFGATEDAGK